MHNEHVREGQTYKLVVTNHAGGTQQVATWNVVPSGASTVKGSVGWVPTNIAKVKIRASSGSPVLRLPLQSRHPIGLRGHRLDADSTSSEKGGTTMKNVLLVGVGAVLVVVGIIWLLQGTGVLGGSAMTGATVWAVIGPVVAILGAAMVAIGVRRRRSQLGDR